VNTHLLINTIVQQTMVFIAQLATAGGVRAPLAKIADQIFLDLTRELGAQGLKKKVIADMFGMGLRTYHRRTRAAEQSNSVVGRTVWEAVFQFIQERQPVSGAEVLKRFASDDVEIVTGVLSDFVHSGLAYRAGRADTAVYRIAAEADFNDPGAREQAHVFIVWLTTYRHGPLSVTDLVARTGLSQPGVERALAELTGSGRVQYDPESARYCSAQFEVPFGTERGWEAAVLDHYQALVTAIAMKLGLGSEAAHLKDVVGGSTWTLDVWPGHPHEAEARGTLARIRTSVEELRKKIDAYNASEKRSSAADRIVVYVGQYLRQSEEREHEPEE
jgi:AraC-like DNA-binding protein